MDMSVSRSILRVFILFPILTPIFQLTNIQIAKAAIPSKTQIAIPAVSPILRGTGAIHGGLAGRGFSLLNIKSEIAKSQRLERLTVDIGDSALQPYVGAPGYFHIENNIQSRQVIIHFLQAINAKFDEKRLQQIFSKSPFVKSSRMNFETESQTMSMVLQMKKEASLRVLPVNGTTSRAAQLKIDFFDDSLLNPGTAMRPALKPGARAALGTSTLPKKVVK